MKTYVALLGAVLGVATVASAQTTGPMRVTTEIETSPAEFTAAVLWTEFQKDVPTHPEFPTFGFSLAISGNLNPYVGLVGEGGRFANYDHAVLNPVNDLFVGVRVQSRFFRVHPRTDRSDIRIYGHVLAGTRWETNTTTGGSAVRPGAGADFHTKHGFALRYEYDHCFVNGVGRGLSGGQFLFGLVFGPS
jgi:hypothetical protein